MHSWLLLWNRSGHEKCYMLASQEGTCRIWLQNQQMWKAWLWGMVSIPAGLLGTSVKTRVSWMPGCIIWASWWLLMCSFCSVQHLAMPSQWKEFSLVAARDLSRQQKKRLPGTGFSGLLLMHKLSLKAWWWCSLAFSLLEVEEAPRRKKKTC